MNAQPEIIDAEVEETPRLKPASQALAERRETAPMRSADRVPLTPMEMAYQLIQNGADLGSVKEMLAVSRELAAEQARRAFDAAIAEAKAEIPIVAKNATGHNSKRYADFAAYAAALKPILAKYGLSYRFRTEQTDRITVTCVLSHKDGHSEENSLSGPADNTGSKNAIQAVGSTLTYLQRYTLVQALGLAAGEDDDGKAVTISEQGGPITEEQAAAIRALVEKTGTDIEKFCAYMKVEAIPDIPASQYQRAVTMLEKKLGAK
jgi:hypothetical protein